MARSERAKEFEAQQKAKVQELKAAKKASSNPDDWGRWKQITETYKATKTLDPKLPLVLLGAFAVPFLVITLIAVALLVFAKWHWANLILMIVLGIMVGILAALLLFTRRAESAALRRYEGQAGAGEVALRMLGKQWTHTSPVAVTRQQDVIHRALGPGGLILLGEGESHRVKALMNTEVKRHEAALFEVKAHQVFVGGGEGEIPLSQVPKHIKKLPKSLGKLEIAEANRRLTALDARSQRIPLPKGPLPNARGSRKAMRGR